MQSTLLEFFSFQPTAEVGEKESQEACDVQSGLMLGAMKELKNGT
jgi:hypothetical protein